ncbi:MAG: hypothetical protein ACSW8H_00890 [bacterium]
MRLPQVDGKNPAVLVHHWNTGGIGFFAEEGTAKLLSAEKYDIVID